VWVWGIGYRQHLLSLQYVLPTWYRLSASNCLYGMHCLLPLRYLLTMQYAALSPFFLPTSANQLPMRYPSLSPLWYALPMCSLPICGSRISGTYCPCFLWCALPMCSLPIERGLQLSVAGVELGVALRLELLPRLLPVLSDRNLRSSPTHARTRARAHTHTCTARAQRQRQRQRQRDTHTHSQLNAIHVTIPGIESLQG
jgi:hypothetical protein